MLDLSMFSDQRGFSPISPALVPKVPSKIGRDYGISAFKNNHLEKISPISPKSPAKNSVSEVDTKSEAWLEAFEERAAIMEYSGGLPRAEAERQAKVICLDEFRRRRQHH